MNNLIEHLGTSTINNICSFQIKRKEYTRIYGFFYTMMNILYNIILLAVNCRNKLKIS